MLDYSCLTHYEWLDMPVWVFDHERRRNIWANSAALSFWKAESAEEFLSRAHADMSEMVRERLAVTAADHAQGKIVREQWTLFPKGQPTTVMLASRGLRTPDRRQVMLFAVDGLREGADKSMLRGVEALQHTSVRIMVVSLKDGSILMRNAAASAAFGVLSGRRGHHDWLAMFAAPELAQRILAQVQRGQTFSAELELKTTTGLRCHAVDARPMRDPVTGDLVMQFNARDIADLKATQMALVAAREAAEAASQAKSSFLANMSHEIRTPMNGVLGLTELVLQTELSDRQRKFIELAHKSAKGLMVIINDLLDVAKIEANRVVIEQIPFALHDCLREALQPLLLHAHEKGITLQARVQPGVPQRVVGDPLRLRQVLVNLVGNALKFTEKGEVRLELQRLDEADPLAPGPAALLGARHRHRHDQGADRPGLRAVHAGRRQHHAPLRRHRSGPDHRATPGRADGRRGTRGKPARHRQLLQLRTAAPACAGRSQCQGGCDACPHCSSGDAGHATRGDRRCRGRPGGRLREPARLSRWCAAPRGRGAPGPSRPGLHSAGRRGSSPVRW